MVVKEKMKNEKITDEKKIVSVKHVWGCLSQKGVYNATFWRGIDTFCLYVMVY